MKYNIFTLCMLMLGLPFLVSAQKNKKPQVLVYGSDIAAYAAALQSVKSGVPTIWITDRDTLVPEFSLQAQSIPNSSDRDGGVWLDILMDMALSTTRDDVLAATVRNDMRPRLFMNALERSLTKYPTLQVMKKQQIRALKPSSKGWLVTLANKQKLELRCVIDASTEQELQHLFAANEVTTADNMNLLKTAEISKEQWRTQVVSGSVTGDCYTLTLAQLLTAEKQGFFNLAAMQKLLEMDKSVVSFRSAIGQAVGATAAYLAFFKTTPEKIDARKLQLELLTYGVHIIPFQDIPSMDPHFNAIQRFALAGILPYTINAGLPVFDKKGEVRAKTFEVLLKQLYSRSQLWFADYQGDILTVDDVLSLVKFIGMRGEEVDRQVANDWNDNLRFDGKFDPHAAITRYQFAVLLDRYANPFAKAVSQKGVFIN